MNVVNLINELAIKKIKFVLQQQMEVIQNQTYIGEEKLIDLVKNGNVKKVKQSLDYLRLMFLIDIKKNQKKNEEYKAITLITLLSRAVLEVGVTAKESFDLHDIFMNQVAECDNEKKYIEIQQRAVIAFTQLVDSFKRQFVSNEHVENCKKDIAIHIFKKISLADIAEDINVEETYLAHLFKEKEKITVVQYIHQEKVKTAKNLLKFSSRSVSEIASCLGFTSQSYFGKVFKELTGMTPKEYQRQNRTCKHFPKKSRKDISK